ncbi:hypothetical protein ACXYTJ_00845 [Gilvimarinus sp. F26214L]|uniref:hypothetical protein n=1 Tax=Gilvimarinus sp. DZF01 TaxID=3461371 RepID=UPI0040452174
MKHAAFICLTALAALGAQGVRAHGSVTAEDDLCLIQIGYFRAHFKVHLPRSHGHQEFCEDLPAAGEALFVMDYVHGDLGQARMDFRIVHNRTGLDRFAGVEDLDQLGDLENTTVYYQPPRRDDQVYTVLHRFAQPGEYLGIITARDPRTNELYSAVFPFEVGRTGPGPLPVFFFLLVLCQLLYWRLSRWRRVSRA